ncbi:MAG: cell division/cell wall cluster transcriptional repressor MraZ [Rhodobacterales bacterium]|nr:cell division/cell wall cluster transcriptional repressor MraZ [Rhodobacterales bacterium]
MGGDGNGRVTVLSFTGEFPQRLDGKGRVSIPAQIRRVMDAGDPGRPDGTLPRFTLAYGAHLKGNLRLYTMTEFDKVKTRIEARQDGSDDMRKLAYVYLTQTAEIELDKDGRIVLPARQREKLGIDEGEVVFMGFGSYCELWKAETFAATKGKDIENWLSAAGPDFDPISLLGPLGGG